MISNKRMSEIHLWKTCSLMTFSKKRLRQQSPRGAEWLFRRHSSALLCLALAPLFPILMDYAPLSYRQIFCKHSEISLVHTLMRELISRVESSSIRIGQAQAAM